MYEQDNALTHQFNKVIAKGDEAAAAMLLSKYPHATVLMFSGRLLLEDEIFCICKALRENTTIKCLNLAENNIDDKILNHVCALVQVNRTITDLHLQENCITISGLKELNRAIESNKILTYINLHGNILQYDDLDGQIAYGIDKRLSSFFDLYRENL